MSTAIACPPGLDDLRTFTEVLFRYADPNSYISMRAFDQKDRGTPPILIEGARVGDGIDSIVAVAARASTRAANSSRPGVFAPPVATFNNPRSAAEADIANGVAVSVEIDAGDPVKIRRTLEHILGPVTLALHSGSEWMDPNTGELHAKAHLHWRISEPTRTPDEHAMLKRARWAAAVLVGADRTAAPINHPLRWPGSWNLKNAPRQARIFAGNHQSEIHLEDAIEKLEEAVEAAGLKVDTLPHTSGTDPQARTDIISSTLAAIPNADLDWDDWNRIGMATWRASGGSTDGLLAWADWSAKSNKHNEDECVSRWQHYATSPPSRIGAGTLVYLATQAGWQRNGPRDENIPVEAYEGEAPKAVKPASQSGDVLKYIPFADASANLDAFDFVEDLLIDQQLSIVYGQSNTGKTFWVTDLGFHISAGRSWNGKEVTQGAVIYLALEGSFGILNRVAAFKQEHGMEDANLPFYIIPQGLDLLHPEADLDALIRTALEIKTKAETPVRLIVVDTVARAIAGGNENSSEDMGLLIKNLDKIRHEVGCHVMGIHHSGKDEARGARGWSGLRAAIDTEIEIKGETPSKTAEIVKQRDLQKGSVFSFGLKVVEIGINRRGKPVTSCVVEHKEAPSGGVLSRRAVPTGNAKRALEILNSVLASSGRTGDVGVPSGYSSIPEKWWRDKFCDGALPGDDQKVKAQAFRRASKILIETRLVGMAGGRVWVVFDQAASSTGNWNEDDE